jgi:hypothetical protein
MLLAGLGLLAATGANAVDVDGALDAAYGSATAHVSFDAGAPNSNFQAPTQYTDHAGYDVYMTTDADYWYGFFQAGDDASIVGTFANLYFDVDPANGNGSDIGFELSPGHQDFFIPGPGANVDVSDILTSASADGHSFEVAIPLHYFINKLAGEPYYSDTQFGGGLATLRLSQTFGYSVAGGDSYGANRLGSFETPSGVPEPATWGTMLLGFGLLGMALRRRARTVLA